MEISYLSKKERVRKRDREKGGEKREWAFRKRGIIIWNNLPIRAIASISTFPPFGRAATFTKKQIVFTNIGNNVMKLNC